MAEEEEFEVVQEAVDEVVVDPLLTALAAKGSSPLTSVPTEPGCGVLLALKIALKFVEGVLVVAPGSLALARQTSLPLVCSTNPAPLAAALARTGKAVIVCAGDGNTAANLQSVAAAAEAHENILYLCCNNLGYSHGELLDLRYFARGIEGAYVASASISHPEDYIRKLQKAAQLQGFRFIDVMAPCPIVTGFDPSNTVHVARLAVDSGLWPLYERRDGRHEISVRPPRFESVERFLEIQEKLKSTGIEKSKALQEKISKNWKWLS